MLNRSKARKAMAGRSRCAGRRSSAPIRSRRRPISSRVSAKWCARASSNNCEFINVESEFAALSVAIGASAAGARAYTATASQGLLFMAEAVYNAAGLGLPIVMTLGNRAIGAPINIWNDHSDAMAMRECRLDPAVRRDQPGGGRPAHPGLPPGRGTVRADDGLRRRLHPHPCRRARRHSRRRRRSTPSCRRSSRCRCSIPPIRSRSARWSGRTPSPKCAICNITSSMRALALIAKARRRIRAAIRPRRRAACCAPTRTEDAETDRRRAWARSTARSRT